MFRADVRRWLRVVVALLLVASGPAVVLAGLKTWDGKHDIDRIEVTVVYFVPRDRAPLPDWRERVDYYCRRIERFHAREFDGQSTLTTRAHEMPFTSSRTTAQLRDGDANFIFFQTLREVDSELQFARGERTAYPILLVLSDVNWRPLEDFYRLRPGEDGPEFEGQLIDGRHFPGATSGGARATYLADRGVGWGLVSADGWRVPYSGTDCVVYHEGVGHPIGLPHPEPADGSVMSLAQYRGWLSESWLNREQLARLGWEPPENEAAEQDDLYSTFRALPDPLIPKPGEDVSLTLEWPEAAQVRSCRVRIQTDLFGPWVDVAPANPEAPQRRVSLGRFDRPSPVSYRVDVETQDGQQAELWGYFQVRTEPDVEPIPVSAPSWFEASAPAEAGAPQEEIDLLALIDPDQDAVSGQWTLTDEGRLESPKQYGARVQIPYQPPPEYDLTVIAEPLDAPNGLILGQRSGESRFLVLVNHATGDRPSSALENVDGENVGRNATTTHADVLKQGRLSQVVCRVRKDSVRVEVDGREIIHWAGDSSRLSLSDYWKTPDDRALFLGAYDCRYRFYRVSLTAIGGPGQRLREE